MEGTVTLVREIKNITSLYSVCVKKAIKDKELNEADNPLKKYCTADKRIKEAMIKIKVPPILNAAGLIGAFLYHVATQTKQFPLKKNPFAVNPTIPFLNTIQSAMKVSP